MLPDDEGFIRACVDAETCIHCNLCNKVCPAGAGKLKPPSDFLAAYAAWNASLPELKLSSSGGIFSVLANRTLAAGGVICGAIYDNNGHVYHTLVEDAAGLSRMRGSKYVQSEMRDCYSRIKEVLKENREVLFSGTGCQVAGLKAYLGRESSHLLTLEIVCEGTPSPGVWERHLHHVCPNMAELHYLSFRDKAYGWTQTLVAEYTDIAGEHRKIAIPAAKEPYIKAMHAAICQARNCYNCQFREGRSGSDILIGDMWALRTVAPEARPECGASVIICNSERGVQVVNEIKQHLGFCKSISPLSATINNGYVYRAPVIDPRAREIFYNSYKQGAQLPEYIDQAMQQSNRVAILNHAGHCNYGSNLTSFALQEALRRMGYDARTVSLVPFKAEHPSQAAPFASFSEGVIRWTRPVYGPQTCTALNHEFDTFIVGSDQVWRYPKSRLRRFAEPAFYLDFAAPGKRRVAYAASFGIDRYQGPSAQVKRLGRALQDFDAVSVREEQGCQILKKQFGYDGAAVTIDPVFLLSRKDWQRFSLAAEQEAQQGALCSMFFFFASAMQHTLAAYAEQQGVVWQNLPENGASVMTWLRRIEYAGLVVTDSFHTLCFAIIFKRPFVVVSSDSCGKSRMASLLEQLGLAERIIDMDDMDEASLLSSFTRIVETTIDYSLVEQRLAELADASREWLQQAMRKPVSQKKNVVKGCSVGCKWEKLSLLRFRIEQRVQALKHKLLRRVGIGK